MSDSSTLIAKLDELSEVKTAAEVTRQDYEARRAEILMAVQAELEALEVEYQPLFESVEARVKTLDSEIRADMLQYGASVKGAHLHAIFSRGRVSWDTEQLDQYALKHPEIVQFRKQGEPIISLRTIK